MGYQDHKQQSEQVFASIPCGIITISDTRTFETDASGTMIRDRLLQAGHHVVRYEIIKDDPVQITTMVQACEFDGCKVIITSGGTGITRRDSTFEAIDRLLQKRLPGFGELFRMLSYNDIGPGAMLSRATAGTYEQALVFCLPGSTGAVRLGMEKLILPELVHLVWETMRQ